MLDEIHNKYELDSNKIVATVTDNGANFIKAFKEFGIDIPSELIFRNVNNENEIHTILDSNELGSTANSGNTDENNEIEDIDDVLPSFVSINSDYCDNQETSVMLQLPHHERCASHTLNLIAVTDVKNAIEKNHATRSRHTAIMAKCSLLWNKCSYPKSAEIVKNVLGHYLSYPGVTRWNSYYDSISQIVKEKNKLSELFLKLGLKNSLKESELAYLNEYCKVLEPLATALDKLQAENNNYYGYLLPCIVSLRTKFVKMQSANLKQTNHILDACLNGLEVRFKNLLTLTDEANNAIIAAFTIPQFKLRWYNGIKDTAIKSLQDINKIIVMAAKNVCAENETSDRSKVRFPQKDDFFDFNEATTELELNSSTFVNEVEFEIMRYSNDPNSALTCVNDYAIINKLFIRYNTSLPSSAPVERMFSFASIINAPKRHALSDTNFENLVLLKANGCYEN
ncbi:uncharacterized protein LOC116169093 [Photinus pyralis]|uniref:uncharacterized protein LOC116169093 n=1 Tax=Photinus pyralis TaxID=7054 RepID=UPI001266F530|nr:uncharacterized protein LOC116169093 [Photinus pyralis]